MVWEALASYVYPSGVKKKAWSIESVFGPDLRVIKVCLVTYLPTYLCQYFNEGKPDTILEWDNAYRFLSLGVQESEQVSQRLSTSGTYTARLHSGKTFGFFWGRLAFVV